jgi:WW domain-containing oxidoreductase
MWIFGRKSFSGFSASSTAEEVTQGIDGTGLTTIVTGASNGIGTETARVLALRGVHVVMAVRNTEAGGKVREAILKENPNAKLDVMELDLASMASVRKFALDYKSLGLPLNLLINNAGVMSPFMLTKDNIELNFGTNHIGHFLLTNLLLETMKSTARESQNEGRIVNVSSWAHNFPYREGIRFDKINDESSFGTWFDYAQSKLANILHANELARRFKEEGVNITCNSLHPGAILTNLNTPHHNGLVIGVLKYLMKNIPQGAATTCYMALHPQVKGVSGEYFSDCNIAKRSALAKDEELAKKLWDFSLNLTDTK